MGEDYPEHLAAYLDLEDNPGDSIMGICSTIATRSSIGFGNATEVEARRAIEHKDLEEAERLIRRPWT